MIRLLVIFLIGGLVGWIFSRSPSPVESGGMPETAAVETAPKLRYPRSPQDFAAWADQHAEDLEPYGAWFTSRSAELANWPMERIRAALSQGISDPGVVLPTGDARKALCGLFGEFSKRDPAAAWSWLLSLSSEAMRGQLGSILADAWPADQAEEGMALVMANREYFESGNSYGYGSLSIRAFESAATRGPAAVDELLTQLREQGMQIPYSHIKFPEQFDFAAWSRAPGMAAALEKNIPAFFIDSWMIREPRPAMDFLFELNRAKGRDIATGLFAGMSHSSRKEPEVLVRRTQAVAARTGSLPPSDQQAVIKAASEEFADDPDLAREFAAAIPDAALRADANLSAARARISKDLPAALEFLAAASPMETRAEILEQLLTARQRGAYDFLTSQSETAVRKTLADWNTPPEQIEALLATMKQPPR